MNEYLIWDIQLFSFKIGLYSLRAQEILTHMAESISIKCPCRLELASCLWIQQMFLLSGPMGNLWTLFPSSLPRSKCWHSRNLDTCQMRNRRVDEKVGYVFSINSGHQWFESLMVYICAFTTSFNKFLQSLFYLIVIILNI